jgi:hypothetical protein
MITPASNDVRKEAFKFNPVTYYQYREDTGRQLNKMRIFEENSHAAQIQQNHALNDIIAGERDSSD